MEPTPDFAQGADISRIFKPEWQLLPDLSDDRIEFFEEYTEHGRVDTGNVVFRCLLHSHLRRCFDCLFNGFLGRAIGQFNLGCGEYLTTGAGLRQAFKPRMHDFEILQAVGLPVPASSQVQFESSYRVSQWLELALAGISTVGAKNKFRIQGSIQFLSQAGDLALGREAQCP